MTTVAAVQISAATSAWNFESPSKGRSEMKTCLISLLILFAGFATSSAKDPNQQLRVGVVGLTHDHVHGVLRRHAQGELTIVGIAEPNRELADRYAKRYDYNMELVFNSIDEMLDTSKPKVVSDYGSIYGHLKTVEASAPRGIHVMVEKPLAISLEHARRMQQLAERHAIHLLTNYETTWYASHHAAKRMISADAAFGGIRKIVVHDGHPGPAEIGCSKEFLEWLTDPKLNGGGALTDFGCYGANLSTWLMNGEKPKTVTAVTQQLKPDKYPNVDDEATIIITYPTAQAILQASWNWNYNRKDIEVYCRSGFVHCLNATQLKVMRSQDEGAKAQTAEGLKSPLSDPYMYFAAVVRGEIQVRHTDLSSLQNNVTVIEILEAAKISATESRTVRLEELSVK